MERPTKTNAALNPPEERGACEKVSDQGNLGWDNAPPSPLLTTFFWDRRSQSVELIRELRRTWA